MSAIALSTLMLTMSLFWKGGVKYNDEYVVVFPSVQTSIAIFSAILLPFAGMLFCSLFTKPGSYFWKNLRVLLTKWPDI